MNQWWVSIVSSPPQNLINGELITHNRWICIDWNVSIYRIMYINPSKANPNTIWTKNKATKIKGITKYIHIYTMWFIVTLRQCAANVLKAMLNYLLYIAYAFRFFFSFFHWVCAYIWYAFISRKWCVCVRNHLSNVLLSSFGSHCCEAFIWQFVLHMDL